MKYLRAFIYWIYPQQGVIDSLKFIVKRQEDLIQTLKCQVQSERVENEKLWKHIAELNAKCHVVVNP